jgi:hypothetical protein
MPSPTPAPPQITIGTVRRQPGTSAGASAGILQGVQEGLAAAAAAVNVGTAGRLRMRTVRIQLPPGAGILEVTEAVRSAVDAGVQRRRA